MAIFVKPLLIKLLDSSKFDNRVQSTRVLFSSLKLDAMSTLPIFEFSGIKIPFPEIPKSSQILVYGEVVLDRYWKGTTRVTEEAPTIALEVKETEDRLGGATNVAANVSALIAPSLDSSVLLVALTGRDESATRLLQLLSSRPGIVTKFIETVEYTTVTKLRGMAGETQLFRVDLETPVSKYPSDPSGLISAIRDGIASGMQVLIISDYGVPDSRLLATPEVIALAKTAGIPVIVDPKGRHWGKYAGATLVKPNRVEFESMLGSTEYKKEEIIALAREMALNYNWEAMLVTLDSDGMVLVPREAEDSPTWMPAWPAAQIVDVNGAGDTVIAALAVSLSWGLTLKESCLLANGAAGVVVSKSGTSSVTRQELQENLQLHLRGIRTNKKILSLPDLLENLKKARRSHQKIVFTNGCFDVLHFGHVSYLTEAQALGDKLIIAVNMDEYVRRVKGQSRPIHSLESRMRVLAALECADWIVPLEQDTPEALIRLIKPDVLVKGGDYPAIDQIVGHDFVSGYGGQVRLLNYAENLSSSRIIATLNES